MFQLLLNYIHEYCDAPRPWGLYFQDSAAPQMEGLVELHDNIMFYLIIILFGVGWVLVSVITNYNSVKSPISHKYLNHGTLIELVWTITPALILILIAFPSFKLLYLMDEVSDPAMSVLAEGQDGPKSYILNKIKYTITTSLVLFGQRNYILFLNNKNTINYLHSRKFHTRMKAASRIGPHSSEVLSVIVGSLLGDCLSFSIVTKRTLHSIPVKYSSNSALADSAGRDKPVCPLNPFWVTGFSDAESSFIISIIKSNDRASGWSVKPIFAIELHGKDIALLNRIQLFFGVGNIITSKRNDHVIYSVKSTKDIYSTIIPHFIKYPLLTQKQVDFELFKTIVELIIKKEHLTKEGLIKIVELRASLNRGLSPALEEGFPGINPVERPLAKSIEILDMNWLRGFIDGEGCFYVNITQNNTKTRFLCKLDFNITQHIRDVELFEKIQKCFGCGNLMKIPTNSRVNFVVAKFSDIVDIIIPFFDKYPLQSSKRLDFEDFLLVVNFMKRKEHLTSEGLEKIRQIKSGMNKGRNYLKIDNAKTSIIQKRDFHTRSRPIKRVGPHEADVFSVTIGSLLGGCAIKRSVEGTRLCFRQSVIHKEYLFWLYNFFYSRGYCSNLEPRMYTRKLKKRDLVTKHYGYEFNTFTFRSFNWIHVMFYKHGKKVISSNIEQYITPLALAVWIMDDGGWAKPGVRISTHSFSLEEVQFLSNILIKKFDLDCIVQKIGIIDKYSIYIKGSSVPTLRKWVLPHIHSSMHYKLGI